MERKPEPTPFDQKLFLVFIVTFASMTVYEFGAQFLYPYMPDWRSKLVTIFFVSGLAVIIAYFPLNSYYAKNVQLLSEMERRHLAEKELRESEDFNRGLVENMPDMVAVYGNDRKIRYTNPAVTKVLGYSAKELAGTTITDYVIPGQRAEVAQVITERLATGTTKTMEVEIVGKDGQRMSAISAGSPVRYHAEPAVLLVLTDITSRKYLEETIMRSNRQLALLSSITRHDINNQLVALDGYTELLRMKMPDDPQGEDYLFRIAEASSRIAAMIRFTREYKEIGSHVSVWQDLHDLVKSAATAVSPGRVTLTNDLPSGMAVLADPLIVKVFFNLIDNALRHGGKITTIRFSFQENDGNGILVCEDDGDGVPREKKDKIFDPGFGENTGFGLALSREILGFTGITIRECGDPGKGARFEITVPKGSYRSGSN